MGKMIDYFEPQPAAENFDCAMLAVSRHTGEDAGPHGAVTLVELLGEADAPAFAHALGAHEAGSGYAGLGRTQVLLTDESAARLHGALGQALGVPTSAVAALDDVARFITALPEWSQVAAAGRDPAVTPAQVLGEVFRYIQQLRSSL